MSERRSVPRLNPGQPAPDFAARTKDGQIVRLSDFRGQIIWLIFYRYPGCPICNLHLSALTKRYSWIHNSKVKVITVFESPAELFPKSLAGQPYPPFPFIADPERRLYQLYQTECLSPASILRPRVAYKFFEALFHGKKQGKVTGHLGKNPLIFLLPRMVSWMWPFTGETPPITFLGPQWTPMRRSARLAIGIPENPSFSKQL